MVNITLRKDLHRPHLQGHPDTLIQGMELVQHNQQYP